MHSPATSRESAVWGWLVLAVAAVIAVCGARDSADAWNDGSRLATVEALVDHHTWCIDRSVFLNPSAVAPGAPAPYAPDPALRGGTLDKLLINGHYYSDKSPVPSLWLAAVYAIIKLATGWTAATHADAFCRVLTLLSSGLGYVIAVWSIYRLGRPLGLPQRWRLILTAGFGLTTIALPYARCVNNHIMLLAVVAALMAEMAQLAHGAPATWGRMLRLGLLAGMSYTIDVGTGPLLLGGAAVWLAWRCRPAKSRMKNEEQGTGNEERPSVPCSPFPVLHSSFFASYSFFLLAAAPWVLLHHALNYMIGGTLAPANAVPAYVVFPGSGVTPETMTGVWGHPGVLSFVLYALDLLVGKQGFLGHNLLLGLAVVAILRLWLGHRSPENRPECMLALVWCVGTWLLYSVTSTNHSGVCLSIRWFVPLLAPAFYILAVWLRYCPPAERRDFVILACWGGVLGALMWWVGPWWARRVPGYWAIQIASLTSVLVSVYLRWREPPAELKAAATPAERKAA